MKAVFVAMVVAMAMLVLWARPGYSIACDQVRKSLGPCMKYLTSNSGNPTPDCCNGVRSIQAMTPTTGERRAACSCIKQAAGKYHNIKPEAASSLPGKCNVHLDVPIRSDIDCNSIS